MLRKKVAASVVSAALCAGLVPASAFASISESIEDKRDLTLEQMAEERNESSQDLDAIEVPGDGSSADSVDPGASNASKGTSSGNGKANEQTVSDAPSGTNEKTDALNVEEPSEASSISIIRDGQALAFSDIQSAVEAALDGETVTVAGDLVLSKPIEISGGKDITMRADADVTFTRSDEYPQTGNQPQAMVKVQSGSSLVLEAKENGSASFVLDGQSKDSQQAIVIINGGSSFTMKDHVEVKNGMCSWKPWAGVYVNGGSFILDGGTIKDCFAQRNAAVAVEKGSSFEMIDGSITGNRSTYSEATVWNKGSFIMRGGSIEGNRANSGAEQTGTVYVWGGGSMQFLGGTIGNSSVTSSRGITIQDGSLTMGEDAYLSGSDKLYFKGSNAIEFTGVPAKHSSFDPLEVVLGNNWDSGRTVAKFASSEDAAAGLAFLSVKAADAASTKLALTPDPQNSSWLSIASGDAAALFDLLDDPYADNLGFQMKDEFLGEHAFDELKERLDAIYAGVESLDKDHYMERIEYLKRQKEYLEQNHDAIQASVLQVSELGDPVADRNRTKQNFMFDNLDATGYYLKPGKVNELYLYVDAQDPSKLSMAWRQVGLTDNNQFSVLGLHQRTGLKNGVNKVEVDLTNSTYGYMVYMRNDSESNQASVRFEGADANEQDAPVITGNQIGSHPYYLYDADHPEEFWSYVQELREYAQRIDEGSAQDMTMLQMGDQGRAQFAIRAKALVNAYASISNEADAVAYIQKSNKAIQDRLEFFWAVDGYDESEEGTANAVSKMRVHTVFTKTVNYPSTMYATGRYFHMPEGSAAGFLSGDSMYGWGMSHEYGHVLDNSVIVVNEETNNMYSIAGARNGELINNEKNGTEFSPSRAYHPNAVRFTNLWDGELAKMAADSSYSADWYGGGWGYYIWHHMVSWWNGTHFFDKWDYSDYDYSSSPFTPEDAAEVGEWGAFGSAMRILRSDTDAVNTIQQTTSSISDGTVRQYNRIAMVYSMSTGYNFAEYLQTMGQKDLSDEVLEFCAQYPSMPVKLQYYSLNTDAAELNGAQPYSGKVTPLVSVNIANGIASVEAKMSSDELTKSTTAYELYYDGELVGFSRTGDFKYQCKGNEEASGFSVVAYDVRLNTSEPGSVNELPFDITVPQMTVGSTDEHLVSIDAPASATFSYSMKDPSVAEVDEQGKLTPRSAGSTVMYVTMHLNNKDYGPFEVLVKVDPVKITVKVNDAQITAGEQLSDAGYSVEGSLLEGEPLGAATYYAEDAEGAPADLTQAGTYELYAEFADASDNYDITVEPGTLTVVSAPSGDGDGSGEGGTGPGNEGDGSDEGGSGSGDEGNGDDGTDGDNDNVGDEGNPGTDEGDPDKGDGSGDGAGDGEVGEGENPDEGESGGDGDPDGDNDGGSEGEGNVDGDAGNDPDGDGGTDGDAGSGNENEGNDGSDSVEGDGTDDDTENGSDNGSGAGDSIGNDNVTGNKDPDNGSGSNASGNAGNVGQGSDQDKESSKIAKTSDYTFGIVAGLGALAVLSAAGALFAALRKRLPGAKK